MPKDIRETLIESLLRGTAGYQKAREPAIGLREEILKEQIKNIITPKKYEPQTLEELKELEAYKAGLKEETWRKRQKEKILLKKPSRKEQFELDVGEVLDKVMTWDELREKYPTRLKDIEELQFEHTPIRKAPGFEEPTGLLRRFEARKPLRAVLSPKAKNMISQIKSETDYKEFIQEVDKYIKSGAWTKDEKNQVLEYFGRR